MNKGIGWFRLHLVSYPKDAVFLSAEIERESTETAALVVAENATTTTPKKEELCVEIRRKDEIEASREEKSEVMMVAGSQKIQL